MAGIASNIGYYLIGVQSAKGSIATSFKKIRVTGDSDFQAIRTLARYEMSDTGRDRGPAYVSGIEVGGTIPVYLHPDAADLLFYAVLGARATVSLEGQDTPANDLPWLTIHRMLGNVLHESFIDCKVGRLEAVSEEGSPVIVTLNVMGIQAEVDTPEPSSVDTTLDGLLHSEICGLMTVGGDVVKPTSLTLTIENNASVYRADCIIPESIDVGQRQIDLAYSERFQSAAVYNEVYYGNASPADGDEVVSALVREAAVIRWERDASTYVEVDLPQVLKATYPLSISSGGDPFTVDVATEVEKPSGSPIITVKCKPAFS